MSLPQLSEFRIELPGNGLAHIVFDAPGRSMNVFSEAAIVDIGRIARWLEEADVKGALIRSGKPTGFCAGANLPEIWAAYDTILTTPKPRRFVAAYEHFFRLSLALRALETCGKPVASAVAGLALGGGGELALASHYRVLTDDKHAAIGLPESLVGLLPGAGGTQRLPRLAGVEKAMPALLDGKRFAGEAALAAGVANKVVKPGEEIAAAESWLLSSPEPLQPWDREDWAPASPAEVSAALVPVRQAALRSSLGHYPAVFAILDCVEFGLPQSLEGGIRSEMTSFVHLVLRPEPRSMIQTMFLGRVDYERLERKGQLPEVVERTVAAVREVLEASRSEAAALACAGFSGFGDVAPLRDRCLPGYWIASGDVRAARARDVLARIGEAVRPISVGRSDKDLRIADYAAVRQVGYPAYLGGPYTYAASKIA
ncbi:enoyl-CoA hydratase-related protein [Acidiphilium sp.]|jgi:3-hydroxyacyl-CoA dehydrogenase/enoyl-CoA hydratase/3-hydroxybutyryl-CoA epimerase|uniref:enoyl-CoA hydratase-related protein n=1 Tax=Acidiphilium sp. TaxID=527 RepID=UPI0025910B8A|nr:enoyl-CoA hydratase-related protein [Acidiphilium sp.]